MAKKIRLVITQKLIDAGCHSPNNCPFATAAQEFGLERAQAHRNRDGYLTWGYGGCHIAKLTTRQIGWINSYDRNQNNAKPGVFIIPAKNIIK